MPKVSVIIPTYNRANMVGKAIESVFKQTYPDWELLVVDDGSQDDTRRVITAYPDPPVRYIFQDNGGTSKARNTGVKASTGEYIAFLDSDDLFLPDKLGLQVAALDRNPHIGLVASGWTEVDTEQAPLRDLNPWRLTPNLSLNDWLNGCPVIVPAVLVRRSWLIQVGLFDDHLRYVEDWDLWLRLAYAGCSMSWEPGLVCLRTVHTESKVRNIAAMSDGLFYMLDKLFAQPDLPEELRQQRDQIYARAHLDGAVRAFAIGMEAESEEHLTAAVQLNPKLLAGQPPAALQSIASSGLTHLVNDIDQYVTNVCRVLPKISPKLVRSRRQMGAIVQATAAFDDMAQGRRQQARLKAVRTIMADPRWMQNRGLLSILLKP
jgi:hypothetical protein